MFGKKRKSKKNIKKKSSSDEKISKIRKFLFLFLLVIFIGVSFWVLFFSPLVKIHNIKIVGFEENFARGLVVESLDSPYLGLIPQDNILLASSSQIKKVLQRKIILAQDIKVKKIFPDSVEITFSERNGVIIWCKENNKNNCFLIDENGRAFYKLTENEDLSDKFPVVLSRGAIDMAIGEVVIKPELALFCSEIGDYVQNEAGLKLNNNYQTPSFMSGEIKTQTEQGWHIYFNSFSTAYEQSKLLESVLEENIKEDNFDKIEYIDLRLNGKVLYKLKEEEQASNDEDQEDDQAQEDLQDNKNK